MYDVFLPMSVFCTTSWTWLVVVRLRKLRWPCLKSMSDTEISRRLAAVRYFLHGPRESPELEVWFLCGRWLCLLGVSVAAVKGKTADSAVLTSWFPALAGDLAYTTAKASLFFWSVTRCSLGMGKALKCQWPLEYQKPLLGHPSCCHGLFGLHVHHISQNHSQHLLNLLSRSEIIIEVLQSTVPLTWFHYLKNKAKHARWGSLGWAGVFCDILWLEGEYCSLCNSADWLVWDSCIPLGTTLILACIVHFSLLGHAWKVWTLCSVSS